MSLSTRGPWTTSLIGNLPSASVTVSQPRYPSEGRTYYDKKIAEGKTSKEALRRSNGAPQMWSIGDS